MLVIRRDWGQLKENEWPPKNQIFVCGGAQPNWPRIFVARMQGKKYPLDIQILGLFWEWEPAIAFAELAEKGDY